MALILSRADIQRCLNMTEAIEAMRVAFSALSAGHAQVPQRLAVDLPEQGVVLLMPSLLQTAEQHAFGLKVITVIPQNPLRGMPRSYASVLLLDATTGKTRAIIRRWVAYSDAYWCRLWPGNRPARSPGCGCPGAIWGRCAGPNAGTRHPYCASFARGACCQP